MKEVIEALKNSEIKEEVVQYARGIDYSEPWEGITQLSPVEQHEEYVSEALYQHFRE